MRNASFLWSMPVLSRFCGLGLPGAWLSHGSHSEHAFKHDPRVQCWPARVRIVHGIHGLTQRCFCNPCSHTAAVIARKSPCLTCQVIKVIEVRYMAASRMICFPRESSGACLCPWGVLPLPCEGSGMGIAREIYPSGKLSSGILCPGGCFTVRVGNGGSPWPCIRRVQKYMSPLLGTLFHIPQNWTSVSPAAEDFSPQCVLDSSLRAE